MNRESAYLAAHSRMDVGWMDSDGKLGPDTALDPRIMNIEVHYVFFQRRIDLANSLGLDHPLDYFQILLAERSSATTEPSESKFLKLGVGNCLSIQLERIEHPDNSAFRPCINCEEGRYQQPLCPVEQSSWQAYVLC